MQIINKMCLSLGMEKEEIIIQGFIKTVFEFDSGDGVYVGDSPLSDQLDYLDRKNVNVRFYISDEERTISELNENLILSMSGALTASYYDRYSDYTGYLWTEDNLKIGNHDLLADIASHKDKYATIIITINQ
jgi:hypothetical protein